MKYWSYLKKLTNAHCAGTQNATKQVFNDRITSALIGFRRYLLGYLTSVITSLRIFSQLICISQSHTSSPVAGQLKAFLSFEGPGKPEESL